MQNGSLECIDRPPSQFLNEFLMVDAPETYILHHHAKFCGDWLVGSFTLVFLLCSLPISVVLLLRSYRRVEPPIRRL